MSFGTKSSLAFMLGLALSAPATAQFGPVAAPQGVPLVGNGVGVGVGRLVNTPVVPVVGPGYSIVQPGSGWPVIPPYISPYSNYFDIGAGSLYRGIGDLNLSYGQYIQDYQRSRLLNQEVERSKIDTRRRLYDEWRYYQSMQPTAEDVRLVNLERDLNRARRQAPIGEVLAGKSLNDLLGYLRGASAKEKRGPAMPLDAELLKHINVTPRDGVSIALIKNGKVSWPLVLRDERFTEIRDKIDMTLDTAINRVKLNGKVDAAQMNQLLNLRRDMDTKLDEIARTLNMSQFMEAKRYLNWLGDGLRALESPDVADFFGDDPKYAARGKTVGDLVEYMTTRGLKFAPALPGDEAAYRTLYTMIAAYDSAVQLISR